MEKLLIRKAGNRDLSVIEKIFADGREFLRGQGLPQWQNGYGPSAADARKDIACGEGYALIGADKSIIAYAALISGADESYENIRSGAWRGTHGKYISIHRVAFSKEARGKGLAKTFLRLLISEAERNNFKDIRIDTHEGNRIMRRVIEGTGFLYRGLVEYPIPFGERMAYQFLLDKNENECILIPN